MKSLFSVFALFALLAVPLRAQIVVQFNVRTDQDTLSISPYIYGSNGQGGDSTAGITSRRLGGNRLTGYNWENNASNAGTDYLNESDNYLTYGLAASFQNKLAIVPILFHQQSQALGAYSLVTLPAAGYVARDKSGPVSASEVAPSNRWCKVVFAKPTPFANPPDTADSFVYDDEEVNFLVKTLGASNTSGIKGYDCDNEPALWPSTHPRIHPTQTTCAEVIAKDSALALAVKSVDPLAEIFGPVAYGYEEYITNQNAPDWKNYSSYGHWIDAYLAKMQSASNAVHKRLLDVLDLHWYPEALGKSANGALTRITPSDDSDAGIARARMDAPRSLWDSSYKENSWITQSFGPIALLPWLNSAIKKNYPGTKLSFSELNYGGQHQISGAIAMADVLGIFGRYGVYMSNYWGSIDSYIASAYMIYRNYDGARSTFGDLSVAAGTSNIDSTSIYAANRKSDPYHLDIILLNKSLSTSVNSQIAVSSTQKYVQAQVFRVDASSTTINPQSPIATLVANSFSVTLPPTSITLLVLSTQLESVSVGSVPERWAIRSASIANDRVEVWVDGSLPANATLTILDLLGRTIQSEVVKDRWSRNFPITIRATNLRDGIYMLKLSAQNQTATAKIVSIKR